MDRITENLLGQFSEEYAITHLAEDKRFEHFSAFCMIRRHYSRSFVPATVVLGGGGDTAIDAIAIIVNNVLVNDVDSVHELAKQNGLSRHLLFLFKLIAAADLTRPRSEILASA